MAVKNKEAWAGKVRLIGIGTDKTAEALVAHVNDDSRKWTDVEQYWKA